MKNFKKVISFALILCMLFAFAGCGAKEEDKFVGTWKATVDMSQAVMDEIAASDPNGELSPYVDLEGYAFDYVWTFNEDGTYTMSVTKESAQAAADALEATLRSTFEKMILDQFAQQGYTDITLDEALSTTGMDIDSLVAQSMEGLDVDDLVDDFYNEGNFSAKDGRLYFSAGKQYAVDENVYDTYEFTAEGALKITDEVDPSDSSSDMSMILPITFEKQA